MQTVFACAILTFLVKLFSRSVSGHGVYPGLGHYSPDDVGPRPRAASRFRRSPSVSDRERCVGVTPPASSKLNGLRSQMSGTGIQAYIIPMDDQHQSEYVSDHDKRVRFISEFTGSSGTVVVTTTKAALWTDGRYFLQGEEQLDCNWILMKMGEAGVPSITEWLTEELQEKQKVGADPKMLSYDHWTSYETGLRASGRVMEEHPDLVDSVWNSAGGRPSKPDGPLLVLDLKYAGESWQDKVKRVRSGTKEKGADAIVVTALDDSAWLFNMRGDDIAYNPVFFAYAIVTDTYVRLYMDKARTAAINTHLTGNAEGTCSGADCVSIRDYTQFFPDLSQTATTVSKVLVSPMSSYAVYSAQGSNMTARQDKAVLSAPLVRILKGRKNKVEVESLRRCHARDSAILVDFVTDLESDMKSGRKVWSEISASDELEKRRRADPLNKGLSFASISAVGSNGAIIHYKATQQSNRNITTSNMYLLDSGGQYLDGTTDVTRTFHYGTPTDQEIEAYTRVLMGSIDLALSVWPNGTYGRDIDVLARQPLWSAGWNYRHGTGHGIGMFLNVHEGPGRINIGYRPERYESPLWGEMFHSDEPGYYEDGKFGVRLETIVMTKKEDTKYRFGDMDYIGFEEFTLVPFEPNLINYSLLSPAQRGWLNRYNKRCLDEMAEMYLKSPSQTAAYNWVVDRVKHIEEDPHYTTGTAALCGGGIHLLLALLVLLFGLSF